MGQKNWRHLSPITQHNQWHPEIRIINSHENNMNVNGQKYNCQPESIIYVSALLLYTYDKVLLNISINQILELGLRA